MMTNPSTAYPTTLLADLDFVRRLARQLCGDEHTAEDVAQQTIVTALEKPPKDGNHRGWLATVARSLVYKHHRTSKRRLAREQAVSKGLDEPSTEEVVAREQVRTEVVKSVLALPSDHRQIILLRFYRGASVAECAERIGITESAVRSRTARAIEQLRIRLDDGHDGDRHRWSAILLPLATQDSPTPTVAVATVRRSVLAMLVVAITLTVAWLATRSDANPSVPQTSNALAAGPEQQQVNQPLPTTQPVRELAIPDAPARAQWTAHGIVKGDGGVLAGATIKSWLSLGSKNVADWVALPDQQSGNDGRFAIPLRELETWSELARAHAKLITLHSLDGYWSDNRWTRCDDVIKAPDEIHIKARLSPGANIRGRILRADGTPVANQGLSGATTEGTYLRQTFADGSFQAYSPGGNVVLACGDGGHGQFLQVVDLAGKPRLDLGDVLLDDTGPFLTGTARYADGTPLANIPVFLQDDPWPQGDEVVAEGGLKFANEAVLTRRGLIAERTTRTDEHGRFRVLHAGPGGYQFSFGNSSYFSKKFELTADGQQQLDLVFKSRVADSHILVIAQDEDGRVLHDAYVRWHIWHGDQAPIARARYEREGYTDELLATTRSKNNNELNQQMHEPLITLRNDSFTLLEVSIGGAQTVRVPCVLPPGRHAATVRVILTPPGRTSALQLQANTSDGEMVAPLFVRVRKHGAPADSSLQLTPHPPAGGASAGIAGAWHPVPMNGSIALPIGAYDLDLLAGGRIDRRLLQGSEHPITHHTVRIENDKPTTVRTTLPKGDRMRLTVSLPRGFDVEGLSMTDQTMTLTPTAGGTAITMLFRPHPGDRIDDGTIVLEAEQGVGKGEYRLTSKPRTSRIVKVTDPNAPQPLRLESQKWLPLDQIVFFSLKPDPFPVQLVEQSK